MSEEKPKLTSPEVRAMALEMASKLSTPGAGPERVLAAAKDYEAYILGVEPEEPPNTIFSSGEKA